MGWLKPAQFAKYCVNRITRAAWQVALIIRSHVKPIGQLLQRRIHDRQEIFIRPPRDPQQIQGGFGRNKRVLAQGAFQQSGERRSYNRCGHR